MIAEARSQYRQLDALVREQSVSSASKDDVSRLRRHMVTRAELNAAVSPVLEKAKTSPTVSAQPPAPLVFTPSPAPAPVSPVYQPVPITHDHTREIQQLFERMQKMQESVNAMILDTIPALQARVSRGYQCIVVWNRDSCVCHADCSVGPIGNGPVRP